jgi:hypothetical protein
MQRRTVPSTARPNPPTGAGSSSGSSRNVVQTQSSPSPQKHKRKHGNVVWAMVVAIALLLVFFSVLFPAELEQVEKEAQSLGQAALKKERQFVRDHYGWRQSSQDGSAPPAVGDSRNPPDDWDERVDASRVASHQRMGPPGRWVEGEKQLKQRLQVLYDRQQQGLDVGVPVLTRWLGGDFPAYVTPDMDAEEWKKNVEAEYARMRREEDAWQAEMQKLIHQRERDIGITTA